MQKWMQGRVCAPYRIIKSDVNHSSGIGGGRRYEFVYDERKK
jgi:hypothetical protein